MKKIKNLVSNAACILSMALVAASCAEQDLSIEKEDAQSTGVNTCTMEFKGSLTGYEQSTRTETIWEDSSRVYLQFLNGAERIAGEALYDAEQETWTVNYYGSLPEDNSLTCEAIYFENIDSITTTGLVVTNELTSIYEDLKGTYIYEDGSLTVVANLTPKTGRIRFTGEAKTNMKLTGITSYSSYEPRSNHFITTNKLIEVSTDANQTTPYIYGYFTNDTVRYLGLMANDYAFTKACKEGMMDKGVSGYLSIPTLERCNGWEKGLRVRVKGVEFLMIPCPDFDTKSSFAIGETEVTQELYQAVMGSNPSYNKASLQHPVENVTDSYNCVSFIKLLNEYSSLSFDLPTREQWQFAANGGNSSQGYTYSGSNDVDAVAWYKDNSNGKTHKVKTKQANELGIYDMSGNVYEWVKRTNSYGYYCGGCFNSEQARVKPTYYSNTSSGTTSSDKNLGFRLAINY